MTSISLKVSYNSPVQPSKSNYDLHITKSSRDEVTCQKSKIIENVGVALPADIFEFLKVQNSREHDVKPDKQRISLVYENIHGGAEYLHKLATLEQVI